MSDMVVDKANYPIKAGQTAFVDRMGEPSKVVRVVGIEVDGPDKSGQVLVKVRNPLSGVIEHFAPEELAIYVR